MAHTGWNLGSENSAPPTAPPIAAPFSPCFFTAVSSSCTARSGACRVSEAKAAKRSGLDGAELGQLLVLQLDDLARELAVAAVPEGVDRQHLHVDGLAVHRLQPLVDLDEGLGRAVDRRQLDGGAVGAQQRAGLAEVAMGVHVDGLDLLAVDGDGQGA